MPKMDLEVELNSPKKKPSEADYLSPIQEDKGQGLDPKAPRKYKSITVTFNEYEYKQLEEVSEAISRGKNDTLRFLVAQKLSELKQN